LNWALELEACFSVLRAFCQRRMLTSHWSFQIHVTLLLFHSFPLQFLMWVGLCEVSIKPKAEQKREGKEDSKILPNWSKVFGILST
jgi:hypothetical protein